MLWHDPPMRGLVTPWLLAVVLALAACGGLPAGLSSGGSLECGGTERALCGAVAELAISQMNLTATGPITAVALSRGDCARAAAAIFTHELDSATDCWRVEVTGERSHGGGWVARFPDGTLKPYW